MRTKPPLLLAHKYKQDFDPTGWWLSEKLDGVRAFWDHKTKSFVSRDGNVFSAPPAYVNQFPDIPLDGELWLGRGKFNDTISVVRSSRDKGWQNVFYMCFDIPLREAGPFEKRQAMLEELVRRTNCPNLRVLPQTLCQGRDFLDQALSTVIAAGGEGLMLRRPNSIYVAGKSSTLLKYKKFIDDEAVVTGYEQGEGKYSNAMGALLCDWNGTQIKVGTGFTDAQRYNPPAVGQRITFRYFEKTEKGKPRHPSFVCVRNYE